MAKENDSQMHKAWKEKSVEQKLEYNIENANLVDWNFIVGSGADTKTFKTHSHILGQYSEVFQTMFDGAFKEAKEKQATLEHIKPVVFKHFLCYIFSDKRALLLLELEVIEDLYDLGKQYMITELCNEIIAHIETSQDCYDAVELFRMAHRIDHRDLMMEFADIFRPIVLRDSIAQLTIDYLSAFIRLAPFRPVSIFAIISFYLRHNSLDEKESADLMLLVDFDKMSIREFVKGPGK